MIYKMNRPVRDSQGWQTICHVSDGGLHSSAAWLQTSNMQENSAGACLGKDIIWTSSETHTVYISPPSELSHVFIQFSGIRGFYSHGRSGSERTQRPSGLREEEQQDPAGLKGQRFW